MARSTYADRDPNWPTCMVDGCDRPCANHGGGKPKHVCSRHHTMKMNGTYPKPIKCENEDGHLGWYCPTNIQLILNYVCDNVMNSKQAKSLIHEDHINGRKDGHNNNQQNIQYLCSICHQIKTMKEGDNKGFKYVETPTVTLLNEMK
jgi:5-methylcytosine-specific restriction endonuclease McrA